MKNNKRKAILLSAYEVFKVKGYSRATVSEIAKGASVGKGTIYEYFNSKYDLFYKMIENLVEVYLEEIKKAVAEEDDPIEKLKAFYDKNREQSNILYAVDFTSDKDSNRPIMDKVLLVVIENREDYLDIVKKIIVECIESGIIKKEVDVEYVARFYFSICSQFSINTILKQYAKLEVDEKIKSKNFVEYYIDLINN